MFAGLYLIGAGMFFTGIVFCVVSKDEDGKGSIIMRIISRIIVLIGLLSFPLITIAYGIKLIINN
jgi:hypothetical protein